MDDVVFLMKPLWVSPPRLSLPPSLPPGSKFMCHRLLLDEERVLISCLIHPRPPVPGHLAVRPDWAWPELSRQASVRGAGTVPWLMSGRGPCSVTGGKGQSPPAGLASPCLASFAPAHTGSWRESGSYSPWDFSFVSRRREENTSVTSFPEEGSEERSPLLPSHRDIGSRTHARPAPCGEVSANISKQLSVLMVASPGSVSLLHHPVGLQPLFPSGSLEPHIAPPRPPTQLASLWNFLLVASLLPRGSSFSVALADSRCFLDPSQPHPLSLLKLFTRLNTTGRLGTPGPNPDAQQLSVCARRASPRPAGSP